MWPRIKDTFSGASEVAGREGGGLAMFYTNMSPVYATINVGGIYQFELDFAARSNAQRLNAFFARNCVVETQECLLRLYALAGLCVNRLQRYFEGVRG